MRFDRCLGHRSKSPMPWKAHQSARSPSQGPLLTSAWHSISSMPGNPLKAGPQCIHNTWMYMPALKIHKTCSLWLSKENVKLALTPTTLIKHQKTTQICQVLSRLQIRPLLMFLIILDSCLLHGVYAFPLFYIQVWALKYIRFQPVNSLQVSSSWNQCQVLRNIICAFE